MKNLLGDIDLLGAPCLKFVSWYFRLLQFHQVSLFYEFSVQSVSTGFEVLQEYWFEL